MRRRTKASQPPSQSSIADKSASGLTRYRGQHEKYDKAWKDFEEPPRPAHFELRFGRKHPGEETDEDVGSADKAFQLDIGGESIDVAGRIDRIDVGQHDGKTVFNVIDYKSGRRPTLSIEKIESGESMQPALYVMAAQALVFGEDNAQPLWTGYWSMQGGVTTDKRYSLHCTVEADSGRPSWQDIKQNVIARIAEIVHAARAAISPSTAATPTAPATATSKPSAASPKPAASAKY